MENNVKITIKTKRNLALLISRNKYKIIQHKTEKIKHKIEWQNH